MVNEITSGIVNYIIGGKAEFMLFQEPNIKVRYRVTYSRKTDCFYVYVRENGSFVYHGFFRGRNVNSFKSKKGEALSKEMKALQWVFKHENSMDPRVHIIHNGKCSVCGRTLTDLKSIELGVGPVCMKKLMYLCDQMKW